MIETIRVPELDAMTEGYRPRREWSKQDEAILATYYGAVPVVCLARYLDRSVHAVQQKAYIMGLSGSRPFEAARVGGES